MKKLLTLILSIVLFASVASADFFTDVIVTSPNGIWTDSRAYTTLNDAVAAVGANDREIVIASPQTVTTLTIPANVRLRFLRNGSITNSGYLNIQTTNIQADNRRIFTGVGNIDFAAGTVVKTGWFSNIESAFALTVNDTVTLIVTKPQTITASYSLGNNVNLKWEAPGNVLTTNAGATVSNINQIEAGNFQLFAGAGNFRFRDGTNLNSSWFIHLRNIITWVATNRVTLTIQGTLLVDFTDTVPSNIHIDVDTQRGMLSISPGVVLTINSNILAGTYQWFTGTGDVIFGPGSVNIAYPNWWGFVEGTVAGTTPAQKASNSVALQSAIDSLAPIIKIPNGQYCYDTGLVINRNIRFDGAGSIGTYQFDTDIQASDTQLLYTGNGIGISIGNRVFPTSVYNVHLSNFLLQGTVSAIGGIKIGTEAFDIVTWSSLKNITIAFFTNAAHGYGLNLEFCLETLFENVRSTYNRDGIVSYSTAVCTTLRFINTYCGMNERYGAYFDGGFSDASFIGLICESNDDSGLYITGTSRLLTFDRFYSENNGRAPLVGTADVMIVGTVAAQPSMITFNDPFIFGEYVPSDWIIQYPNVPDPTLLLPNGYAHFYIDYANNIVFNNPHLLWWYYLDTQPYSFAFGQITANATYCSIISSDPSYTEEKIYGNHSNGMKIISPNRKAFNMETVPRANLIRLWKNINPYQTFTSTMISATLNRAYAKSDGVSAGDVCAAGINLIPGKFYKLYYDLTNIAAGELPIIFTGENRTKGWGIDTSTAVGENYIYFQATSHDKFLFLSNAAACEWTFDAYLTEIPLSINSETVFAGETSGGLMRHTAEATATPSGTTTFFDILTYVPVGARLLGCQLQVETALTAGETWSADYIGGATTAIIGVGQAVAKSTRTNTLHIDEITATNPTNVRVTRDAGNFTDGVGVIRATIYYESLIVKPILEP
ncbi:MAG: hypothetical protein KKF27_20960 [Gammaproteobacteria bacterium]|nr:hypothetical protein [Gammaproteobacteria bacterium]